MSNQKRLPLRQMNRLKLDRMTAEAAMQRTANTFQTHRFAPRIGTIAGLLGSNSYWVCYNNMPDGWFEYLCGVKVAVSESGPDNLKAVELPRRTFVIFSGMGHVSNLSAKWQAIFC